MPSDVVASAPGPEQRFPLAPVLGLATLFFSIELLTSFHPSYGYFLDELYYIACATRLDLGYVDHPPLAPAALALSRALLGDSLPALRLLPALCGALTLLLAARIVWRLGGGLSGQLLAALCVTLAPVFLVVFSIFSMNCFEVALWTGTFCVLVELGRSQDDRLWWLVGTLLGLAVLSKHTSLALGGAIALGVALSPLRRHLLGRNLWLAVGLFLLLILPNVWWQARHGWASLEFYVAVNREGNVPVSPLYVLGEQIGSFNPATFPVWAAGLYFFLLSRSGRRYRFAGWVLAALFAALLLAGRSRPDRIMGAYPVLFAAGAVQLEALFVRPGLRWLRYALPAALIAIGLGAAPFFLPILTPEAAARYTAAAGEENEIQREVGTALLLLPLAHRRGSEELAEEVSRVYAGLDPSERERAVILAESYATAGAIELLGGAGLPPVYSPHNSYYLWGPPETEPGLVIAVGFEPEQLAAYFDRVEVVARAACRYCMGWRQEMPIALARAPRRPLREAWPELRRYGYPVRKHYLLRKAGAL
jgi:4-amino-4-deoxy-L-arabinose transferase-like glycosyltransferase